MHKKTIKDAKDLGFIDVKTTNGFTAILRLYNTYWWKSLMAPFFLFAYPIIIYAILGNLMNRHYMFGGTIAMTAMTAGVLTLPWNILELKQSVLLKRVGASPVKTKDFTAAIVLHTIFTAFLSILWLCLFAFIMFRDESMFEFIRNGWTALATIFGILILLLMSISIGFIIASLTKTQMSATTFGLIFYLPAGFLSGQWIGIDVVANSNAMNWVSLMLPFRYPTMFVVNSMSNAVDNPFVVQDILNPTITGSLTLSKMIDGGNGLLPKELINVLPQGTGTLWKDLNIQSIDDLLRVSESQTPIGLALHKFYGNYMNSEGFFFSSIKIYKEVEFYVAYTYPIVLSIVLTLVATKTFRWSGSR